MENSSCSIKNTTTATAGLLQLPAQLNNREFGEGASSQLITKGLNSLVLSSVSSSNGRGGLDEREITLLSPSSPPAQEEEGDTITTAATATTTSCAEIFAQKLQMKLNLLETSESCSSEEEFYSGSTNTQEDNSSSEIFYDFEDHVVYGPVDDELTSDYGTGGSNSTIVECEDGGDGAEEGSSSSGGSVVVGREGGDGREEEEGEEEGSRRSVRYQRSSSLKSGNKTPPGTPMKKIVRFADAMGLDLIDIKVFLDEIPRIPKEAYRDLHIPDYINNGTVQLGSSPTTTNSQYGDYLNKPFGLMMSLNRSSSNSSTLNFVPLFHQPVMMPDFFDKIRDRKVLLENAYLMQETVQSVGGEDVKGCDGGLTLRHVIKGTVRVMNLDFHKSVYIRYSYNDWKEFSEFQATYIPESCDGFSDRFEFRIEIDESKLPPPYIRDHYDDAKISFACRFHCQGSQFWDNNQSRNYVFQNVPAISKSSSTSSSYATGTARLFGSSSRYSSFDDFDYEDEGGLRSPSAVVLPSSSSSSPSPQQQQQQSQSQQQESTTNTTTSIKTVVVDDLITSKKSEPYRSPEPSQLASNTTNSCGYSSGGGGGGGGGGSHLSSSLYSPVGFYESAYGCYSNSSSSSHYGSACFY